jgi:phosphoribosylanthranilate isomerase
MMKVKICGITNIDDAMAAIDAGADALGFVFYAKSPRAVDRRVVADIVGHLPPFVTTVGVFVDEDRHVLHQSITDCGLHVVQLHGTETAAYCTAVGGAVIKAVRPRTSTDYEGLADYRVSAFLLDTYHVDVLGGTGLGIDWNLAAQAKLAAPIILAGGLTPETVADAVRRVRPYGVDVSSGVERAPGKKDHAKVRRFIASAKGALAESF